MISLQTLKNKLKKFIEIDNNQDNEIFVKNKSKAFSQIEIEKLNRINIFAGLNNCGKTSLLEAISFFL